MIQLDIVDYTQDIHKLINEVLVEMGDSPIDWTKEQEIKQKTDRLFNFDNNIDKNI